MRVGVVVLVVVGCNYTQLTLVLPLRTAASETEEKLKKDHHDLVEHVVFLDT